MLIFNPNQSYTFLKIFELKTEVDDLVADFGYSLNRSRLELHEYSEGLYCLDTLQNQLH